jgi:hypothetical protein
MLPEHKQALHSATSHVISLSPGNERTILTVSIDQGMMNADCRAA